MNLWCENLRGENFLVAGVLAEHMFILIAGFLFEA